MARNYFKKCIGCQKRKVGCQATCETYLTAKAAHDDEKDKVIKGKIKQSLGDKYNEETTHRLARRYRGK